MYRDMYRIVSSVSRYVSNRVSLYHPTPSVQRLDKTRKVQVTSNNLTIKCYTDLFHS